MSTELPAGVVRTEQGFYVLERDSHLSVWCREAGRLDIAEAEISSFAHLIPQGGTVIDAGACLGDHTATYAKLVGPLGTVFAFEPGRLTYEALWRNFEDKPHVKCFHAALGHHEGRTFHKLAENVGGSHLGDEGDSVHLTTIDALGLSRLDLVHLDCEGFEPQVLRGGMATLRRLHPAMVLEINKGALGRFGSTAEDVYALLDELGYDWAEMAGGTRESEQRDILCLPRK